MNRLNLTQGDAAWHAHRAQHFNASDAAAMLGCSHYTTRSELLHRMYTGLTTQVGATTQRLYDDGHRFEALARPLGEKIIGEPLYPVVGTEGRLSASFDGLTMAEDVAFEHKTLNDELRACIRDEASGHDLPKHYRVQMEQQLMVSGAERVLFMATKWTPSGELVEERHCWYASDPSLRTEILAGWAQFEKDLSAYVPPAASTVEKIAAEPVEALPAPVIQVSGQLTLQDNFQVFEQRLRHFLDHVLIREPKTDQDFADLDQQIKAMKAGREALKGAKAQMLAQVQPVDQASKTADMLDSLLQQNCSLAERLLKDEKERRKGEIVAGGVKALADHIAGLNQRLGKPYMPQVPADFGGAVRGLKSLASMEDKVGTELARAKIAAHEIADRIQVNLTTLRELAADFASLFADTPVLVLKAPDDCRAQVEARIAAHKAEQERKLEAERARIRAEEEAKAAEKVRQEQEALAREQRQREEQEAAQRREADKAAMRERSMAGLTAPQDPVAQHMPAATVHPLPTRAPAAAPSGPPTVRLGHINQRLAPLAVDAAALASLGFPHSATEGAAKLWHDHQFPAICDALIAHVAAARNAHQQAA